MSLPFLKPKHIASVIMTKRKSDGTQDPAPEEHQDFDSLDTASADLIRAVSAKDEKGVTAALRAAFQILDSEQPEEGPSLDEGQE